MEGKPVRMTGFVKPGSLVAAGTTGPRFIVVQNADGSGKSLPVDFAAVLPDGIEDGVQVVMGGALEQGTFVATSVALEQSQK